jgi:hypothetical protein
LNQIPSKHSKPIPNSAKLSTPRTPTRLGGQNVSPQPARLPDIAAAVGGEVEERLLAIDPQRRLVISPRCLLRRSKGVCRGTCRRVPDAALVEPLRRRPQWVPLAGRRPVHRLRPQCSAKAQAKSQLANAANGRFVAVTALADRSVWPVYHDADSPLRTRTN